MFELNVVPLLTAVIGFYAVLFVAIAGILTRLAYVPSRKEFRELQYNLRQEMAANHTDLSDDIGELRQDMGALRIELKQDIGELRQDMGELRTELKQDMGELRTELKQDMAELRTEFKQDMTELRQDMGALRTELKQDMTELRSDFKQEMTQTRQELLQEFRRSHDQLLLALANHSHTDNGQAMFTVPPELAPAADDGD